jgi:hypothetical protein
LDYVFAAKSMILESDPYGWIFSGRLAYLDKRGQFNFYRYERGVQTEVNP